MAISAARVTRFGLYGGMDRPAGSFAGKTPQVATGPAKNEGLRRNVGKLMK